METKELNFRRNSETEKNRKRIQGIAKKYEFFLNQILKYDLQITIAKICLNF